MTMKIRKIIRDKKDAMKNLLTFMYDSVCAQKAILEMLLEDLEEDETNLDKTGNEPRELIKVYIFFSFFFFFLLFYYLLIHFYYFLHF